MKLPILCFVFGLFLFGCKKKTNEITPLEIIETGLNIRIQDLVLMRDTNWIVAGGVRDLEGYILRSSNQGSSWQIYQSEFPKSIYTVEFRDSLHGMAGGDFLHLWTTSDGGVTWQFYWLGAQVPFNGEDRPAVRDIAFASDTSWYFCGGENLGEGILYSTIDAGTTWDYKITGNEMRCIEKTGYQKLTAGGHGAIWKINHIASLSVQTTFENDFITGSTLLENGNLLCCSYNGKIYEVNANDDSVKEKMDGNRLFNQRINWNSILLKDGVIMVCGNDGMIGESLDQGSTWSISQLTDQPHLFSLDAINQQWWFGGEAGKLYRIR